MSDFLHAQKALTIVDWSKSSDNEIFILSIQFKVIFQSSKLVILCTEGAKNSKRVYKLSFKLLKSALVDPSLRKSFIDIDFCSSTLDFSFSFSISSKILIQSHSASASFYLISISSFSSFDFLSSEIRLNSSSLSLYCSLRKSFLSYSSDYLICSYWRWD